MRITIDLSPAQCDYLTENCIQRITNAAIQAVPDDYDYLDDLEALGATLEPIRVKLVNAIRAELFAATPADVQRLLT